MPPKKEVGAPPPSIASMAVQNFALTSLIVAKPIFDLLENQREYFVANGINNADIYLFIAILSIALPIIINAPLLVTLVKKNWRMKIQSAIIAVFLTLYTLQLVQHIPGLPASLSLITAILFGAVTGILYTRKAVFARSLTYLAPLIVIFPALFLFSDNMQRLMYPEEYSMDAGAKELEISPPIVMLVFDEFALTDLLDAEGKIDAKRFPNFAKLADDSTWYSNATTVWPETMLAIPVIMTGKWPHVGGHLPRIEDFPQNIFTILEPHYSLHIAESVTELRPPSNFDLGKGIHQILESNDRMRIFVEDMAVVFLHIQLPDQYTKKLPSIGAQWGGFLNQGSASIEEERLPDGKVLPSIRKAFREKQRTKVQALMKSDRKAYFDTFIDAIEDYPVETLHFIHILLPHRPSSYLPSGKTFAPNFHVRGIHEKNSKKAWEGPKSQIDRIHQYHLLQVGFVDTILGRAIDKLKSLGIYDESLFVLAADHGISFQHGISNRRVYTENYGELAFVPLFIKKPGQKNGFTDTTNVETIDILPTITDILGAEGNYAFDGRSLIDPKAPIRETKNLPAAEGKPFKYSKTQYLNAKAQALARNIKTFSLDDPRSNLYHYGIALDLIGLSLADLRHPRIPAKIYYDPKGYFKNIDLDSPQVQTRIVGSIKMDRAELPQACIVVSVNNSIQGAARPYELGDKILFDFMIPDTVLKQGYNRIRLEVLRIP